RQGGIARVLRKALNHREPLRRGDHSLTHRANMRRRNKETRTQRRRLAELSARHVHARRAADLGALAYEPDPIGLEARLRSKQAKACVDLAEQHGVQPRAHLSRHTATMTPSPLKSQHPGA